MFLGVRRRTFLLSYLIFWHSPFTYPKFSADSVSQTTIDVRRVKHCASCTQSVREDRRARCDGPNTNTPLLGDPVSRGLSQVVAPHKLRDSRRPKLLKLPRSIKSALRSGVRGVHSAHITFSSPPPTQEGFLSKDFGTGWYVLCPPSKEMPRVVSAASLAKLLMTRGYV